MLGGPVASFVLFSVVLLSWHLPFMFDATLKSTTLHAFEHTLFFTTALMFWKQAIPSPPLHTSLVSAHRVVFCIGGMIVSWVLAVVLALAPPPPLQLLRHEASSREASPHWQTSSSQPASCGCPAPSRS